MQKHLFIVESNMKSDSILVWKNQRQLHNSASEVRSEALKVGTLSRRIRQSLISFFSARSMVVLHHV